MVKLTLKVLCALTLGQPIVNNDFWHEYVRRVEKNEPAPDPKHYVPIHNESLLGLNVDLTFNPARKTLFAGKIFVFSSKNMLQSAEDAISVTGLYILSYRKNIIYYGP